MPTPLVSIHGGHSGQFCNHARDSLEDIVLAYIRQGFAWVGITEHMPPKDGRYLYPEERQAGLDPKQMQARFGRYIAEARRLQALYRDRIDILVAFETEAYSGCLSHIAELIDQYQPDYVVGGVHHVADIAFDYGPSVYLQAIEATGGVVGLYCRYFDRQLELIQKIRPSVVAHLDLIRIFDPDYAQHLQLPEVRERIVRNLELISRLGLMLDYNVAALRKGASEPYVSRWILALAKEMGLTVVPSDDAHSVDTVGARLSEGIAILVEMGFDTRWPKPGPCR
jgi:histidinol-phosphatase (PHP family)